VGKEFVGSSRKALTMRKTAILLGASSGIGKEMALLLASQNWQVAITGRRQNLLDEIAATNPDAILTAAFDVNEVETLPDRLDTLVAQLNGLDLLVVSAGCGYLNTELASAPELQTISTNVTAFTASITWAFNYFKKQNHGHIAAITSVAGMLGGADGPAYAASKAYQINYLDSVAKLAKKEKGNCQITELRPGSVNTDMMKGEGHFWISTPQDAARLACEAISKGKRLQYISKRWRIVGFILRCLYLFK